MSVFCYLCDMIEKDSLFAIAERYVENTSLSIFLTGKAGTGKTTFLKYIVENTSKRCVVLAPTGVAAVNAHGSTIHSFFSLPLCPYLPDVPELRTEYQMPEQYRRLRKDKIKIIRTLDLLIIDEISMVRADLLDAVDMTLRRYRRNTKPFGGIQLLMIGDAQQLSPVVTEAERPFIERVYKSSYFFNSKALGQVPYITIELQTVYRQSDVGFLNILNAIRDSRISGEQLRQLNSRVNAPYADDWIRLTTHNWQADGINTAKMDALPGDGTVYTAHIEGDYPESLYPAAPQLKLKVGARVMFIRNDPEGRYYNGKMGTVTALDTESVTAKADSGEIIDVSRSDWENTVYTMDDASGEIVQAVSGTFSQFPLRPAWAITIHKSQGLTFGHVVIDAGAAFAFGQVYVALSRCRSLEGISLASPVNSSILYRDSEVVSFHSSFLDLDTIKDSLPAYEQSCKQEELCSCFSFDTLRRLLMSLRKIWRDSSLSRTYPSQMERLEESAKETADLESVAEKFRRQLASLQGNSERTAERVSKACDYFLPRLECLPVRELLAVEVDSSDVRKQIKNLSADLLPQYQVHLDTLRDVKADGFDMHRYRSVRNQVFIEEASAPRKKKIETRDIYKDNRHPELVEALVAWRRKKAEELDVPAFHILHQKALLGIADTKPDSRAQMLSVHGFGPGLWEKYGLEILKVIRDA